jgi:hypothetical protein
MGVGVVEGAVRERQKSANKHKASIIGAVHVVRSVHHGGLVPGEEEWENQGGYQYIWENQVVAASAVERERSESEGR